jgi:hypothetical protein
VLGKFRLAVDYRQTTIRKLQRESGSVNRERLSNRDIIEDTGVLISVVTVTSVESGQLRRLDRIFLKVVVQSHSMNWHASKDRLTEGARTAT